jgi:hypothetical protein
MAKYLDKVRGPNSRPPGSFLSIPAPSLRILGAKGLGLNSAPTRSNFFKSCTERQTNTVHSFKIEFVHRQIPNGLIPAPRLQFLHRTANQPGAQLQNPICAPTLLIPAPTSVHSFEILHRPANQPSKSNLCTDSV